MKWVVGLTGGIASGKSTVAQYFDTLGVPIIDADQIARELVRPPSPLWNAIVEHFGPTILKQTQSQSHLDINRLQLRTRIFSDFAEKSWLENLLHPPIYNEIARQISLSQAPYLIVLIPLLAEHYVQYKALINHALVVDADPEVMRSRLLARDGISPRLADQMIAAQATREQRLSIAESVITNTGNLDDLQNQVQQLHQTFFKQAS